jgi:hypothetical protein
VQIEPMTSSSNNDSSMSHLMTVDDVITEL